MASKKLERMPEEVFIEEALKSGRARRDRLFSMKALGQPDAGLQARVHRGQPGPKVHLDMDHVARLGHILETIGPLHPVVVFFDKAKKKYYLADGFHRHEAYRISKKDSIDAIIIDGDYQHALEYATMCNRLAMKGRTREDMAKAVEMLLTNSTWKLRADSWIASHVGCDRGIVRRTRAKLGVDAGESPPETVQTINGKEVLYKKPPKSDLTIRRIGVTGDGRFRASANGVMVHGRSQQQVATALEQAQSISIERRLSTSYSAIKARLESFGFRAVFEKGKYPGLSGFYRPGIAAIGCDFSSKESLPLSCGRLVAVRRFTNDAEARMVIICYIDNRPNNVIDLYRQEGFEFLSPEELIAQLAPANPNAEGEPE